MGVPVPDPPAGRVPGGEAFVSLRVLLADDEPDVRMVVRMQLERRGWDVEEASSGYEALEVCRGGDVDVAVLDQRMGGFTGMEVADILRRESFESPIIIFSAYLDPGLEADAARRDLTAIPKTDISALLTEIATHEEVGEPPKAG